MISDAQTSAEVLLAIAITVPLALMWVAVFVDLFRRKDLSVLRKALWATLAILAVHVGVLLYFVFRPIPQPPGKNLAATTDRSSSIVGRLEQLRDEYRAGSLTDDEYLASKRELLGVS